MTRTLATLAVLAIYLFCTPTDAVSQAGCLGLYADPAGLDCTIDDVSPGVLNFYVVHTQTAGATGVSFSAPAPSCLTANYLGDSSPFGVVVGNSQTGVAISYGACLPAPIHVMTIQYFGHGTTPADCGYTVLPHPDAEFVDVADCDGNTLHARFRTTYINSSLSCYCSSPPDPTLLVNPLTIDFGSANTIESFTIYNLGLAPLHWNITESTSWLSLSQTSGTDMQVIDATIDRTGLAPGFYSAQIVVTSNGGTEIVTARVEVEELYLQVTPNSLAFDAVTDELLLSVDKIGHGTLVWSAHPDVPWLSVAPDSGVGTQFLTVEVDRTGLSQGIHNGAIAIQSNGGDITVPVTLQVLFDPVLVVSTNELFFSPSMTVRTFGITNEGVPTLTWTVTADQPWIHVNTASGTEDATVTVEVDPALLTPEPHSGLLTVASNAGAEIIQVDYVPPTGFGGNIGVYTDVHGTNCNIIDSPGQHTVYFVHTNVNAASASQFAAPQPACAIGATWLTDVSVFPVTIGNTQNGVSVGYGTCLSGPIHVLSSVYFMQDATHACCDFPVVRHPDRALVEAVDCSSNIVSAFGVTSTLSTGACGCGTVAVHESTWGRIKSMYRE